MKTEKKESKIIKESNEPVNTPNVVNKSKDEPHSTVEEILETEKERKRHIFPEDRV